MTFDLDLTALSNMPELETHQLDNQWNRTDFDVTPIMSTYVLAFIVSDFKYKSLTDSNGLKVK